MLQPCSFLVKAPGMFTAAGKMPETRLSFTEQLFVTGNRLRVGFLRF
jgi:hypothetical protein